MYIKIYILQSVSRRNAGYICIDTDMEILITIVYYRVYSL